MHEFRKVDLDVDGVEFKGNPRAHTYLGLDLDLPEVGAFAFAPEHTRPFLDHYSKIHEYLQLPLNASPRRFSRVYTSIPEMVIFILGKFEENTEVFKKLEAHADLLHEMVSERLARGAVPIAYKRRRICQQLIARKENLSLGWWYL